VFNTYGTQTTINDQRLISFLKRFCQCNSANTEVNLYRKGQNENYPMNWVISEYQLNRMDGRVKEVIEMEMKEILNK
jgi:hypothetical protein